MKKFIVLFSFLFIAACDNSDSDSGGMVEPTIPGTNIPAIFLGVYTGTLNATAEAAGITRSDTFPITVTVTEDAMVRIDGDDPDETITVGLNNDGSFRGNLPVDIDDCEGTLGVDGTVDGTTARGTSSGSGTCLVGGLTVEVTLSGDFTATK